jgi:hypothetical protein
MTFNYVAVTTRKQMAQERARQCERERKKGLESILMHLSSSMISTKLISLHPSHRCYYAREKNRKLVTARFIGTSTILTAL